MPNSSASPRIAGAPSLVDSLIPLAALVALLSSSVYLYGDSSSGGANQIALFMAGVVAILIGLKNGHKWSEMNKAIQDGIAMTAGAIIILLAVGALIGTWLLSGTVASMIYYGLKILDPGIFYAASCVICVIVSLSIGSSWTVVGTIGVGLIGISAGLGLSPEITAGAIISGAYFGDKMSPLSDTTNLAPAIAGSELFEHIRHMMWTTVPSLAIAIIIFGAIGLFSSPGNSDVTMMETLTILDANFNIGLHLLIPIAITLLLAVKKVPAFLAIFTSALIGGVFAVLFQPELTINFVNRPELSSGLAYVAGVWTALFDGFHIATGSPRIDDLLNRGGMSSMLNTVWLILSAMFFGGIMERTGMLARLIQGTIGFAKSTGSLITLTMGASLGSNIITAEQYISIVLPGRMFREEYRRRNLAPVNLSRALEDAGTITSPLVPWNTCGAFMAGTLGVATFAYLPFCFFNLINPLIGVIYAYAGYKILELPPEIDKTGAPTPLSTPIRVQES